MALGWHFVDLTDEQKAQRRITLDIAANVAQYSALIPLLCLQIYFLFLVLGNRRSSQHGRLTAPSLYLYPPAGDRLRWSSRIRRVITDLVWWAGTPVGREWGTTGEWLLGAIWGAWLLLLSTVYTGNDYFHVTKRFGIVAASQLPLHYLLALKSPYSPLQLLTRLSHEQLNRGHQVLGRTITVFFYAHGVLYLNFFIQSHSLLSHLKGRVVLLGLLGLISFTLIGTTSLSVLRTRSYRLFYITHITLATLLLPILFFHVHHIRLYIWESLLICLLHSLSRYLSTRTLRARISLLPSSSTPLLKIDIPLPQPHSATWRPGDHVYLSLPPQHDLNTPAHLLHRILASTRSNPFTIASNPLRDGTITLIARVRDGSTKRLADVADSGSDRAVKVRVEGPYGAVRHLPDLRLFDRVLLVAGGVGGTFAVPIFRGLRSAGRLGAEAGESGGKVRLVWFVRGEADAEWAVPKEEEEREAWRRDMEIVVTGGRTATGAMVNGKRVVGGRKQDNVDSGAEEDIELAEREGLLDEDSVDDDNGGDARKSGNIQAARGRERLVECLDELFAGGNGEVMAVLVCGPPAMGRSVRAQVRQRARHGMQVFFHAEEFGL